MADRLWSTVCLCAWDMGNGWNGGAACAHHGHGSEIPEAASGEASKPVKAAKRRNHPN